MKYIDQTSVNMSMDCGMDNNFVDFDRSYIKIIGQCNCIVPICTALLSYTVAMAPNFT